jgi:hypothetical protein
MPYQWIDSWARIPGATDEQASGKTHGVCVATDGRVVVFHQNHEALLHFSPEGELLKETGGPWLGAHGLTRVLENGNEFLWLTDQFSGVVAKTTLDGEIVQTLPPPQHPKYDSEPYSPTWVARHPIDGRIYVADGYGASLVHVYDKEGVQQDSWDGGTGAGPFAEPHGIACRTTPNGVEVWVADRSNHRLQIFDAEGTFLRASMACHSPCMFDFHNDQVVIPELFTGVKVFQASDLTLLDNIGYNSSVQPHIDPQQWWPPRAPDTWPNTAASDLKAGFFNSPHAACFSPNGDIYVVEWILGGRITKLEKINSNA